MYRTASSQDRKCQLAWLVTQTCGNYRISAISGLSLPLWTVVHLVPADVIVSLETPACKADSWWWFILPILHVCRVRMMCACECECCCSWWWWCVMSLLPSTWINNVRSLSCEVCEEEVGLCARSTFQSCLLFNMSHWQSPRGRKKRKSCRRGKISSGGTCYCSCLTA